MKSRDKEKNEDGPIEEKQSGHTSNPKLLEDKNQKPKIQAPEIVVDPFDLDKLRLSQDFSTEIGVKKIITTVPCRKPNRQEFVRVRSGEHWRFETAVFEDKSARETYLVASELRSEIADEIYPVCLFTTVTRQGDLFLWPVRIPGIDGKTNSWNDSSLAAALKAEAAWIRVVANMRVGYYDTFEAAGSLGDPEWPDLSFEELLRLSFRDRFLEDFDHPVLRSLRGEA